jgi:hypothetical protein
VFGVGVGFECRSIVKHRIRQQLQNRLELRPLLAIRRMVREAEGRAPSTRHIDDLLRPATTAASTATTRRPLSSLRNAVAPLVDWMSARYHTTLGG